MLADAGPRVTQSKVRLLYFGADLKLIAALQQVLTKPNYQLVTSSNYEDAILFLRSGIPYDLLLIDFDWPGEEGLKLARRARSIRHRKRMPIVLVAAKEPSSETKMLARKAGATEWVMKKEDIGEVLAQIVGA
jgi:two-component system phosphate regulon response regulator PhoB